MKNFLNKIKRRLIVNRHTSEKRLHMSEKNELFSNYFFSTYLKSLSQTDFMLYPDVLPLKEKIAKKHNVNVENIFLGFGSDRVLSIIFNTILNVDDIVYVPSYHFPLYDVYAAQNNAQVELISFLNKQLDFNSISKTPSLFVIDYPNTILGNLPSEEFLKKIERYNVPIILDCAYSDFAPPPKINMSYFSVFTFSKGYGACGVRVGYCISSKENIELLNAYKDMFEITGPSVKYCCHLLDNEDEIIAWRKMILKEKNDMHDVAIVPEYGNWIYLEQDKFIINALHKFDLSIPELSNNTLAKLSLCENVRNLIQKR